MTQRNSSILIIFTVIALFGALFVYQPVWSQLSDFRPWRLGLDVAGGSHLEYSIDMSKVPASDESSVLSGLRDVIEKRVDLFGVSEPQVYIKRVGSEERLVVELAGIKNLDEAIAEIGTTPTLDFRTVTVAKDGTETYTPTGLTGSDVTGASVSFDQYTSAPVVNFELTQNGAKLFADLTRQNIGKPIAVFLDNKLLEEPTVREEITGGKAQISGNFTVEAAQQLAARFNAGALPAPIQLVDQETVSPLLGAKSFHEALVAGVVGFAFVALYMLLYYRRLGIYSVIALIVYALLNLTIFKLVPVTLSLSSIAGIVLSLGMAVDANVLVFERMKEELRQGIPYAQAVENGFKRAWSSIRDSNIATMISAVILFYITTSFVRGFALALFIGVATSMLTAVVFTRTILRASKAPRTAGTESESNHA